MAESAQAEADRLPRETITRQDIIHAAVRIVAASEDERMSRRGLTAWLGTAPMCGFTSTSAMIKGENEKAHYRYAAAAGAAVIGGGGVIAAANAAVSNIKAPDTPAIDATTTAVPSTSLAAPLPTVTVTVTQTVTATPTVTVTAAPTVTPTVTVTYTPPPKIIYV